MTGHPQPGLEDRGSRGLILEGVLQAPPLVIDERFAMAESEVKRGDRRVTPPPWVSEGVTIEAPVDR